MGGGKEGRAAGAGAESASSVPADKGAGGGNAAELETAPAASYVVGAAVVAPGPGNVCPQATVLLPAVMLQTSKAAIKVLRCKVKFDPLINVKNNAYRMNYPALGQADKRILWHKLPAKSTCAENFCTMHRDCIQCC